MIFPIEVVTKIDEVYNILEFKFLSLPWFLSSFFQLFPGYYGGK
ncbi:hypothetical protein [Bacillus thuringiensis]|nr:hypothetical protein [Bacillus thuringiensis]